MIKYKDMQKNSTHTILLGGQLVDYELVWSDRRKTVSISVSVDDNIRVFAPAGFPVVELEKFLCMKEDWIIRKLSEIKEIRLGIPEHKYTEGEKFEFLESPITLKIRKKPSPHRGDCILKGSDLVVSVPESLPVLKKRSFIEDLVLKWYRSQALKYLEERVQWHSWNTGIRYGGITLTNARRQWGSCDRNGNLRFNWRVIMASVDLIDYLIIHELCHVRVGDHSPKFWLLVEKYIPDYRDKREKLKKSSIAHAL